MTNGIDGEFSSSALRSEFRGVRGALKGAWAAAPASLLGIMTVTVLAGLLGPVSAWLLQRVLNGLAGPALVAGFWVLVVGLVVLSATGGLLPLILRMLQGDLARTVSLHNSGLLYASINRLPGLSAFESPEFRDRLQMAQEACQTTPIQLVSSLTELGRATLTAVSFVTILTAFSPWMALWVVGGAMPLMVLSSRESRRQVDLMWRNTARIRKSVFYSSLMADTQAVKEIRLFGLGDFFRERMLREIGAANGEERRYERQVVMGQSIASLAAVAASAIATVILMRQGVAGRIQVGDVTLYLSSIAGAQLGMVALVTHLVRARQAAILYDTFLGVLSHEPEVPAGKPRQTQALTAAPAPVGLEFRDVWFRYSPDGPWVIRGVSFRLEPNQTLGLIGLNGAGKSTIVKLLCRFYDPVKGAIYWNGEDIFSVDPAEYRAQIAAIFQDYMSYDLTCAENIALGDVDNAADRAAIRRAASTAGAEEFIQHLPAGYETLLSRAFLPDDGDDAAAALLSGGQWQRLALARALMRIDRPLLVMDEPTSGLDPRAEADLQTVLTQQRQGQAVLCISHRLSTVRSCRRIVVLHAGEIVEEGTHEQLMARTDGLYQDLFQRQAKGYALDDPSDLDHTELVEYPYSDPHDRRNGASAQRA